MRRNLPQAVIFLAGIREASRSNLGRDADYSDGSLSWLVFSPSRQVAGHFIEVCHDHFLPRHYLWFISRRFQQLRRSSVEWYDDL
jgi:hypothetical protein